MEENVEWGGGVSRTLLRQEKGLLQILVDPTVLKEKFLVPHPWKKLCPTS